MVKVKKILCVVLSFVMAFGSAATVKAANDSGIKTELLVQYLFENGGADASGNQNDAVIGQGVTVKDGIASLPGGNKDSSAYITLPKGVFDNQNELTIAMWLKDEDPQTSWLGAFFFGSPANANHVPENYYYFVPCEKDSNTLKSVITDSVNVTSPNRTEKGIAKSVNTSAFRYKWTHYAITLKPGSMTCYINGTAVGTEQFSRKVSDFGTGLQSYIGKSNYENDPVYQGSFKDFRVYKGVLTDAEIRTVMEENMGDIPVESNSYSMKIDGNHVTKQLSDSLYGLFYEDINSAADGGL